MKNFALLCVLASAPFALGSEGDSSRCQGLYEEWQTELATLKSSCIMEESSTMSKHFNCESHKCIQDAVELNLQFQDNFIGMCSMEDKTFVIKEEDKEDIKNLVQSMASCNLCIVKYTEFKNVETVAIENKCVPPQTENPCTEKCSSLRSSMVSKFENLIQKQCHQYMPGGCGAEGGITEGEVYDILQSRTNEIDIIKNLNLVCSNTCQEPLTKWYASLSQLANEDCIKSETIDMKKEDLSTSVFEITATCSDSCVEKITKVHAETYTMENECKKEGLISTHISLLSLSISDKSCGRITAPTGIQSNSSKGFLTLAVLICGVVSVFFIVKCIRKRSTKKEESNSTVWKQGLPKQTEMKNRNEGTLLYGDDDDDDLI